MGQMMTDNTSEIFFVCLKANSSSNGICSYASDHPFEKWYRDVTVYKGYCGANSPSSCWFNKSVVDECDPNWQDPFMVRNLFCNYTAKSGWKTAHSRGLIHPPWLLAVVWAMAILAVVGNLIVITKSSMLLKHKHIIFSEVQKVHHLMLINLAVADFLVGSCLLCIAVVASAFTGPTGRLKIFSLWPLCDILGLINTVSSQVSVTILVLMTSFRLYSILWPYKRLTVTLSIYLLAFSWVSWFAVAYLPLIDVESVNLTFDFIMVGGCAEGKSPHVTTYSRMKNLVNTFLNDLDLSCFQTAGAASNSVLSQSVRGTEILAIAYHLKLLNNRAFMINYYSQQTLCSGKYFLTGKSQSKVYALSLLAFNFLSFTYLLVAYVLICFKTASGRTCFRGVCGGAQGEVSARERENTRMQKKIFLIIITDFLTWIPITIVSFWYLAKAYDPSIPESCKFTLDHFSTLPIFTTIFVPINSSLNPILYSANYVMDLLSKCRRRLHQSERSENHGRSYALPNA